MAQAIGYQSENRFRIAFKKKTGLSPRSWRETLRVDPTPRVRRKSVSDRRHDRERVSVPWSLDILRHRVAVV
jgi:hypothetical protein